MLIWSEVESRGTSTFSLLCELLLLPLTACMMYPTSLAGVMRTATVKLLPRWPIGRPCVYGVMKRDTSGDAPFCTHCKKYTHSTEECNAVMWSKNTAPETVAKAIDEGKEVQIDKTVSLTAADVEDGLPSAKEAPASPAFGLLTPVFPASGENSLKLVIDENAAVVAKSVETVTIDDAGDAHP